MNIDQLEERMIRALEGELSAPEYDALMKAIGENEDFGKVWNEYKILYQEMDAVPQDVPAPKVEERFLSWLEQQSDDQSKIVDIAQTGVKKGPIILWRKWASIAAVFICVFGFWKLFEHNQNVENTLADVSQQMQMLSLQKSSTERIKTIRVNYNPNSSSVNDQMIGVLIDVLNTDESSNVRLAAVETLAQFMELEEVREALINRLKEERDGGVKLSIITSLGQRQDEKLKSTLENIVNDDSQEKFVIDEAHMQLIRFEKIDL